MNTSLFTFKTSKEAENYHESIKWSQANAKFEIHTNVLKTMDLNDVVSHCISV